MAEALFWQVFEHLQGIYPEFGVGKKYKAFPKRFKRVIHVLDSSTIQLVSNCIRKERLLSRYIDLDEPEMILGEIAKDVDPGFDHMFYWNIGAKHLARAKKIWSSL